MGGAVKFRSFAAPDVIVVGLNHGTKDAASGQVTGGIDRQYYSLISRQFGRIAQMSNALIGLFIIAHGLVHPILAFSPTPDSDPPEVGGYWAKSWLLGDGSSTKTMIYIGSTIACVLLVLAGLSLMDWIIPQAWWNTLCIMGAALSLLVLVVFWHNWLVVGVVIDIALLILLLFANWNPVATG